MRIVNVQGIPVAVEERGAGRPIVLIHGWQGDHRYMAADLESVFVHEPQWRRIYLDLPGHGQTPAPEWLEAQAQVVSVLVDAIGMIVGPERFAVAGNSYGGYLALGLVRAMPERLLGAALLVPDLPAADGSRDTPSHVTIVADAGAMHDLAADERWIPDRLVEQTRSGVLEIRKHDMPAIRAADQSFLARLEAQYQLPAQLATPGAPFARPSLIVTGRQDATVGYEAAWRLRDEFPRATLATLDLAGHWLGRVERPHAFRALVGDWLERMRIDQLA
jgi:pimeloyl-ACP methyl ester carboxylesterase